MIKKRNKHILREGSKRIKSMMSMNYSTKIKVGKDETTIKEKNI